MSPHFSKLELAWKINNHPLVDYVVMGQRINNSMCVTIYPVTRPFFFLLDDDSDCIGVLSGTAGNVRP